MRAGVLPAQAAASRRFERGESLIRAADRPWLLALGASFAFGLGVSWQRWGNPLIDTGREMNQPLRLASGEVLYGDVRHIYGPLSPWFHALLFDALGPSLTILYIDGIVNACLIIGLLYWLGRQFMRPAAAGAAALSVMWLCVFKPAGNYILPYSYNALHAAVLGLLALAVLVAELKRRHDGARPTAFLLAGAVAGLAILAKTEVGFAAVAAGVTAAVIAPHPRPRRIVLLTSFLVPAAALTVGVYAIVAAHVGWSTLVVDSWLLFSNVPEELKQYNRWVSGFDDPARSLRRIGIATLKLGVVAALVGAVAQSRAPRTARPRPWHLLAAAGALLVVLSSITGFDPDKGPYLAMPLLLVAVIAGMARRIVAANGRIPVRTLIVLTCAVYALASLGRMLLHVRSGGAYASMLLPVSVLLFMYLWVEPFARTFRHVQARRLARQVAIGLVVANAVATAGILAYRYQTRQTVSISTSRGTMIAEADVGEAWNEALAFISAKTSPNDALAVLPEGTSLNFLSGRRNPLRDEISIPGVLDEDAERRAIARLKQTRTPLVLITNRPTTEFGRAALGRDYGRHLMRWIETNYAVCATFGPEESPALAIGDEPFFIRAYCREWARASRPGSPAAIEPRHGS